MGGGAYIYIYPWCGALLAGAPFQGLRAGDAQPPPGPFRRGSAVTSATPSPPPATLAQSRSRRPGDEQGSHMNKNSSEFVGRTVRMTCTAHDLLHHQNKAHERQHKQHHYSFIIIVQQVVHADTTVELCESLCEFTCTVRRRRRSPRSPAVLSNILASSSKESTRKR